MVRLAMVSGTDCACAAGPTAQRVSSRKSGADGSCFITVIIADGSLDPAFGKAGQLRHSRRCTDLPAIGEHTHAGSGKLEKYTGKLCKIHDTLTTIRYAQPGIDCVINLLRLQAALGTALAELVTASTSACPLK
jgi:hypothetical protein